MKIEITGKNIDVTEGIENAIEESLAQITTYFKEKNIVAKVLVRTYPVGQKIEISLQMDGDHTIRQEVKHEDLYAAISMAGKKLERQVRRFKTRIRTFNQKKHISENYFSEASSEDKTPPQVIRRKNFGQ